jgi:hypothetical protein
MCFISIKMHVRHIYVCMYFRVITFPGLFMVGDVTHTCRKYKWYLRAHMLVTLVTPVGTPSSGSTSENSCIQINLDLLKPSMDKPNGLLTVIVPPRTVLGKILSST